MNHGMSPLGFGCSRLVGPLTREEAVRLLRTAFDAGITHFDVARSYGSGDAESVLGEFLRGRRDQVTVTSKFGVQPAALVARSKVLVSVARRAMRVAPPLRRALGRTGASLVTRSFDVATARASLHTSLERLGTDHLDLYFLHDPVPGGFASDEMLDFLLWAVRDGKVRQFGVAAPAEHAMRIVAQDPAFAPAVQCDADVLGRPETFDVFGDRMVATFGALSELGRLAALLARRPELRSDWTRDLDVDLAADNALASLLLGYALVTYPRGPVLVSSTKAANVAADAAVAHTRPYDRVQLDRFASLARTAL